jgi:hypothetical protein
MDTIYLVCAVVGGTIIVCQFLMLVLGLGGHHDFGGHGGDLDGGGADHDFGGSGDHDVHHGSEPSRFLSLLSFRALSAAVAFFGLAGSAALSRGLEPTAALGIALLAGTFALFLVSWLMRLLSRFNIDGTARIERSVGSHGTVYLSIPGKRTGAGKVHISMQNRTLEYKAVTSREDLPTGSKIVVVSVVSGDTVEVAPLN